MTYHVSLRFMLNHETWHDMPWPCEEGEYASVNPWEGLGVELQTFATRHAFSSTGRYEIQLTSDALAGVAVNVYDRDQTVIKSRQTVEGNTLRLSFETPLLEDALGWIFLSLQIKRGGEEETWLRMAPVAIAIPKGHFGTALSSMVSLVREHYGTYLETEDVSVSTASMGQERATVIQALLASLHDLMGPFRACARRAGVMVEQEGPSEKLAGVHAQTIRHLVMHPEHLTPSAVQTGVRLGSQHYLPRRTLNSRIESSFDTEAHRQLLGFLKVVAEFLEHDYRSLMAYDNMLESEITKPLVHPPSHTLTTEVSSQWWYREAKKVTQAQEGLWMSLTSQAQTLAQQYASILSLPLDSVVPLRGLPEPNASWWSHWVYQSLYNVMMRWYNLCEQSLGTLLEEERQLMHGMEMSEVYERFLLIKMLEKMRSLDFTLTQKTAFDYGVEGRSLSIHNTFVWQKGDVTVTVYSEPVIRLGFNQMNGLGLRRVTNYFLDDGHAMRPNYARDMYYSPDMVMAISTPSKTEWVVTDAKLSVPRTVVSQYGIDLIYKYIFGLQPVSAQHRLREVTIMCGKPLGSGDAMPFEVQDEGVMDRPFFIESDIPGAVDEEPQWLRRVERAVREALAESLHGGEVDIVHPEASARVSVSSFS